MQETQTAQTSPKDTNDALVKPCYLVRVDFNPNFVNQLVNHNLETNAAVNKLFDALGTYVESRAIDFCLTFTTFMVRDDNPAAIERRIKDAWVSIFPENPNAIQVLSYISDESETYNVIKEIYSAYFAWDRYCKMVTDMAYQYPLVSETNTLEFVHSQNHLISINDGCGFTTMLSSFSDYLVRVGYVEKKGDHYYEYIINEDKDANFTTTEDLMESLWSDDNDANCIGLDISYFLPREKHSELRVFLKRLDKLQQRYIFLFRIPYLEEKARKEIYDIIEDIVNVKQLAIEPYNELIYSEYFGDVLIKHDMQVTKETEELFLERLRIEKRDGRFYGFKTVRKIAEEAALLKIRHDAELLNRSEEPNLKQMKATDIDGLLDGFSNKVKNGYEELHELIGMEEIEQRIREIVAQVKLSKSNEKIDAPCLHMRFTGAPGTGKTTVARIIGKIFKEEGILRKGNFFEYGARDLCGKYVGQTAPKTAQICRDAYGSVLFVDEAYALYAGDNETSQNDYGREAITTLIAEMENHRDDMVVIFAGYTDDMDKLMQANSGLRSRMPNIIDFKSYTRDQLASIFMNYVNRHFTAGEGLEDAVNAYFSSLDDSYLESKEFANARFVRNLYERTWSKAALRLSAEGSSQLVLTVADFDIARADKEFAEKLILAKHIGF